MKNKILELLKNMDNKLNNLTNVVETINNQVKNYDIISSDINSSLDTIKKHLNIK